jgi:putative flippase GtrA
VAVRGVSLADLPRPLRFGAVGAVCATVQLATLAALVRLGLERHMANVCAGLLATQVNFALSSRITWHDRPATGHPVAAVLNRLLRFNAMSLATLAVNWGVFALAARTLPLLIAGFLGIAAATVANYLASNWLVFRRAPAAGGTGRTRQDLAAVPVPVPTADRLPGGQIHAD